jgi:hypothetical protein
MSNLRQNISEMSTNSEPFIPDLPVPDMPMQPEEPVVQNIPASAQLSPAPTGGNSGFLSSSQDSFLVN